MKTTDHFPFELDNPRAWRTYLGGAVLDELHGAVQGEDNHFPEEWIMSVVAARNAGREDIPNEGMSHIKALEDLTLKEYLEGNPEAFLGKDHASKLGAHPGVLVKLIDSSERLTIQVHPDREKAMELFQTPFGKTECWHILGGRSVDGKRPGIYLGFREGITEEKWRTLFERQDISGMLGCLHWFEVEAGNTILIEGGVPHAIGAGCFLAEIQEPTDYTIRVERVTPSGYQMADESCHQGLGFDRMFECFHYEGLSREEIRRRWFLPSKVTASREGANVIKLVDYQDTSFFAMRKLDISDRLTLNETTFSAFYVLHGKGKFEAEEGVLSLQAPQQIFIPANTGKFTICAEQGESLEILQFYGPKL